MLAFDFRRAGAFSRELTFASPAPPAGGRPDRDRVKDNWSSAPQILAEFAGAIVHSCPSAAAPGPGYLTTPWHA
jgi:hypothetical protein